MDPEDHVRFDLTEEEAGSPKCSFFGAGDDLKVRLNQIGFGRLADMNSALKALAISTWRWNFLVRSRKRATTLVEVISTSLTATSGRLEDKHRSDRRVNIAQCSALPLVEVAKRAMPSNNPNSPTVLPDSSTVTTTFQASEPLKICNPIVAKTQREVVRFKNLLRKGILFGFSPPVSSLYWVKPFFATAFETGKRMGIRRARKSVPNRQKNEPATPARQPVLKTRPPIWGKRAILLVIGCSWR